MWYFNTKCLTFPQIRLLSIFYNAADIQTSILGNHRGISGVGRTLTSWRTNWAKAKHTLRMSQKKACLNVVYVRKLIFWVPFRLILSGSRPDPQSQSTRSSSSGWDTEISFLTFNISEQKPVGGQLTWRHHAVCMGGVWQAVTSRGVVH